MKRHSNHKNALSHHWLKKIVWTLFWLQIGLPRLKLGPSYMLCRPSQAAHCMANMPFANTPHAFCLPYDLERAQTLHFTLLFLHDINGIASKFKHTVKCPITNCYETSTLQSRLTFVPDSSKQRQVIKLWTNKTWTKTFEPNHICWLRAILIILCAI